MMAHCDRCGELADKYPSWESERDKEGKERIYHIYINVDHNGDAEIFCNSCMVIIIELYLKAIK